MCGKKKSIILESVKQALCVRLWQEFGLFVLSWTITKLRLRRLQNLKLIEQRRKNLAKVAELYKWFF